VFSPEDKEHAEAQLPHCMQVSMSLAPSLWTSLYNPGSMLLFFTIFLFKVHTQAIRDRFPDFHKKQSGDS
jgi:hypothetical protein